MSRGLSDGVIIKGRNLGAFLVGRVRGRHKGGVVVTRRSSCLRVSPFPPRIAVTGRVISNDNVDAVKGHRNHRLMGLIVIGVDRNGETSTTVYNLCLKPLSVPEGQPQTTA